jgi:hypothetical protein
MPVAIYPGLALLTVIARESRVEKSRPLKPPTINPTWDNFMTGQVFIESPLFYGAGDTGSIKKVMKNCPRSILGAGEGGRRNLMAVYCGDAVGLAGTLNSMARAC